MARGSHLAHSRRKGAAHFQHDHSDDASSSDADARSTIPSQRRLAERGLQSAGAHELLSRRRNETATAGEHQRRAQDFAMNPLTNATKRQLKARAQKLEPVLKVGHGGVTPGFLASLD